MECLFTTTRAGDISFEETIIDIEEPLREIENLHGLEFRHTGNTLHANIPVYEWTGHRMEWRREKSFKSRAERRLGKMQFGDSGD